MTVGSPFADAQPLPAHRRLTFPGQASRAGLPTNTQFNRVNDFYAYPERFVADVDGDTYQDFIGIRGDEVVILPGMTNADFDAQRAWEAQPGPSDVAERTLVVADVDNDDRADLIIVDPDDGGTTATITVIPGGTDGTSPIFDSTRATSQTDEVFLFSRKQFADVNGDGFLDYLGIDGDRAAVVLGDVNGQFDPQFAEVSFGDHFSYPHRELVDFNNDGYLDFVGVVQGAEWWDPETVTVSLGSPTGATAPPVESKMGFTLGNPYFRGFGDVDGDGAMDYVNAHWFDLELAFVYVYVEYGSGNGAVGGRSDSFAIYTDNELALELADIDQDGRTDLVGIDELGEAAYWVPGSPGGLDETGVVRSDDIAFLAPVRRIVDIDNDGLLDFFGLRGKRTYMVPGSAQGFDTTRRAEARSERFNRSTDLRLTDINHDGYQDLVFFGQTIPLVNGTVVPCSCALSSYPGADFLKAGKSFFGEHYDAGQPLARPIIAQFDTGFGVPLFAKIANFFGGRSPKRTCHCAVVTDLNGPWIPSQGRENRYASSCIGLAGAQCGAEEAGLNGSLKRYKSLIIHDVCQAFIGSTASMFPTGIGPIPDLLGAFLSSSGRRNACGDEGWRGLAAAGDSLFNEPHGVDDGYVPWSHRHLIPEHLMPPE
ncbi:MAG: VCBS repeat-containing protein [Myxococcota bacterium]